MREYVLRVVDRGSPKGVPVVDAYLLEVSGGAEACVLHTVHLGLSPQRVGEVAAGLGELGVRVERAAVPAADPPEAKDKAKKKSGA